MGHQLVELLERAGIEEELDPLARGELPGFMLALLAVFAPAELRPVFEIGEGGEGICQAFTACDFSQSLRNFSSPMLVSGWLNIWSMTAGGQVAMSAPRRAASIT